MSLRSIRSRAIRSASVGDRDPLDDPVAIRDVDRAPVGELGTPPGRRPGASPRSRSRRRELAGPAEELLGELRTLQLGHVLGVGDRVEDAPSGRRSPASSPRPIVPPEPRGRDPGHPSPGRRKASSGARRSARCRPRLRPPTRPAGDPRGRRGTASASWGRREAEPARGEVVDVDEHPVASWMTTASSSIDITASRRRSTLSRSENSPALSRARPIRLARPWAKPTSSAL